MRLLKELKSLVQERNSSTEDGKSLDGPLNMIQTYQKALAEHHNPDMLKSLDETERVQKELAQKEYSDPNIGEAERERGILVYKYILPSW